MLVKVALESKVQNKKFSMIFPLMIWNIFDDQMICPKINNEISQNVGIWRNESQIIEIR